MAFPEMSDLRRFTNSHKKLHSEDLILLKTILFKLFLMIINRVE